MFKVGSHRDMAVIQAHKSSISRIRPQIISMPRNNDIPNTRTPGGKVKRPNMTFEERKELQTMLSLKVVPNSNPPILERGALAQAARHFDRRKTTISTIWNQMVKKFENTGALTATPKKPPGRPEKYDRAVMREEILQLPRNGRKNLRKIAKALGIQVSTLWRYKVVAEDDDDPIIYRHSNAIKPHLTPEHEVARVLYGREKLNISDKEYDDFLNSIHVDEKWFFLTEEDWKVYLTPGEKQPRRTTSHKSHILKIMFLCAVARPRFNAAGECIFDGKIGIWPIVERVVAQRSSGNRPAGTVEYKPTNVTQELYREYMIEKVLPAARRKFAEIEGVRIMDLEIQQDGAKSHIKDNDAEFVAAATAGNWNFNLVTQPARSPDLNINDLGFFRALQTAYWELGFATDAASLIANVEKAFNEYDPRTLEKNWVTLASVIDEILKCDGSNDYKIPHMNKDRILRETGALPLHLEASDLAVEKAEQFEREEEEVEIDLLTEALQEWDRDSNGVDTVNASDH